MQTIITEINNSSTIEIYCQDEVVIDVDIALVYIQSGYQDIKNYVENTSKPEIDDYIKTEAKPIVSTVVGDIASGVVNDYLTNTTLPAIDKYATQQISVYNDNAVIKQRAIDVKALEVEELASDINLKAQNISDQVSLAKEYKDSVQTYNNLCAEAKTIAVTSAENAAANAQKIDDIITNVKTEVSQELNNPFFFGMSQYFESEPNNSCWLQSNGSFHSGNIYESFYEWLQQIQSGNLIISGVVVKLSTDDYGDYDYVVNIDDNSFRLPLKVLKAGGCAIKGNGIALGLENTKGTAGLYNLGSNGNLIARATAYGQSIDVVGGSDLNSDSSIGITADSSKSGMVTDNTGLMLYFYVGETVKDANLINAGKALEQLSTKTTSSQAAASAMPDYSAQIAITNGYVAPSTGWIAIGATNSGVYVNINGINITGVLFTSYDRGGGGIFPVNKGDLVTFTNAQPSYAYFYPCKGVN